MAPTGPQTDGWEGNAFANAFGPPSNAAAATTPASLEPSLSTGTFASLVNIPPQKIKAAMQQLVDLGFVDEARNRDALSRYDFDVNRAVAFLVEK